MAAFTYADNWQDLFAQSTPRDYGVALSSKDVYQCLFSVQMAVRNVLQGVWDSPSYSGAGWDQASWDDQNYAIWMDITSLVRGIEWDAGATDPIQEPEVATAQMTIVNRDGALSPWATSGAFTDPVVSQPIWDVTAWNAEVPASGASFVRAGTPVRFGVNYIDPVSRATVYKPLFTGTIEAVEEATGDGVDAWVTLTLNDISASLAAIGQRGADPVKDLLGTLVDGLTGDNTLAQLLSYVNFPYAVDTFVAPPGLTSLWNTALFVVPDKATNLLAACQLLATSGYCRLHATPAGTLRVVDQRLRTGFAVTFANNPVAGEIPVARDAIVPYSSTDRLLNIATGTSTTGRIQTATDSVSVGQFGPFANALGWPKTGLLLQNDPDVLTLLEYVINDSSNDYQGIREIQVDCDLDPANMFGYMTQLANAGLTTGWEFPVRWLHPSGSVLSVYVQLLGHHFNITMEGKQAKWTGTLRTAKA